MNKKLSYLLTTCLLIVANTSFAQSLSLQQIANNQNGYTFNSWKSQIECNMSNGSNQYLDQNKLVAQAGTAAIQNTNAVAAGYGGNKPYIAFGTYKTFTSPVFGKTGWADQTFVDNGVTYIKRVYNPYMDMTNDVGPTTNTIVTTAPPIGVTITYYSFTVPSSYTADKTAHSVVLFPSGFYVSRNNGASYVPGC